MKFRTAKDITKEDIEWALDQAFKTVLQKHQKEIEYARSNRTGGRPSRRWGHDSSGRDADQTVGH